MGYEKKKSIMGLKEREGGYYSGRTGVRLEGN